MKITKVTAGILSAVALALPVLVTPGPASAASVGTWMLTGSMHEAREGGGAGLGTIAAPLPDGRILYAGGFDAFDGVFSTDAKYYIGESEIYDPATGTWSVTDSMNQTRYAGVVAPLPNGKVLAAGGTSGANAPITPSAELYDAKLGKWQKTKSMSACRVAPSSSVLASGNVLVVGGAGCMGDSQTSAEIYDVQHKKWMPAASMHHPRWGQSATTLSDGRILVAGGRESPIGATTETISKSAEIYDPAMNTWTEVGDMNDARFLHSAGLLPDGRVIAAGGHCAGGDVSPVMGCRLATAEIFSPATDMWTRTADMSVGRVQGASASLASGFLMVGGGNQMTTELYNPTTSMWEPQASLNHVHDDAQLVPLADGRYLIAGGFEMMDMGGMTGMSGMDMGGYMTTDVAEVLVP